MPSPNLKNESKTAPFRRIGIIGLGMLGGSVALAAQKYGGVEKVVAIGRDSDRLKEAQRMGIIHSYATTVSAVCADVELFVICTPVDTIPGFVFELVETSGYRGLITDVGSTKEKICSQIDEHFAGPHRFVAAHPLAGSEKEGFENSEVDLFQKAKVVLAVSQQNSPEDVHLVDRFWKSLGSHTSYCTAPEHDQILALTSHLPHLLASALINTIQEKDFSLSAAGLSSMTRIAGGKSSIWAPIFLENRKNILDAVQEFQRRLQTVVQAIEDQQYDRLASLLDVGRKRRQELVSVQKKNGEPD